VIHKKIKRSKKMNFNLEKLPNYSGVKGPLLLIILDGLGVFKKNADGYPGNAIDIAQPKNITKLLENEKIVAYLKAHGTAVGMPSDDDQGNSEVGHNAMGAGRIFSQGASLVDNAINDRSLFEGDTWKEMIDNALTHKTPVHLIGLLSDGNVHSNISHLMALISECDKREIKEVYVHGLLDGRDVPPLSALRYFGELQDFLWSLRVQALKDNKKRRYYIASGGGRMVTTMDRYEADWSIVERGYQAHVLGEGPMFADALTAIAEMRKEHSVDDQYLPHWVVRDPENSEKPIAQIDDNHNVIFYNFRGDRAIEICRAFVDTDFKGFERKRFPKVFFAGMMEYDGDLHIPPRYLVSPPAIERTVSEYLAKNDISQYAISETQKFGHVTYFWNGNNSAKFSEENEEWVEIESDRIPFDQAPNMKAKEITQELEKALTSGKYKFLRVNFANGDMVGHTGSLDAAVEAVRALDEAVGHLVAIIDELEGTVIITADHGNCEQMYAVNKKTGEAVLGAGGNFDKMTSHTLNPVPFMMRSPDVGKFELNDKVKDPGLGNIASTLLMLLGFNKPDDYLDSIIRVKK
jgi:2,3-bisphosphoglycerate-independent phosphoglycerate mutase